MLEEKTYDQQALRQAQLVMLKILKQVDRVCRENNIPYWLDSGTLLGAVRHKGFIPWDDDVDISMMREDYERFISIAPKELPKELFVHNIFSDSKYSWNFTKVRDNNSLFLTWVPDTSALSTEELNQAIADHNGVFIDVFPMDKLSKREWVRYFWRRMVFKRVYDITGLINRYGQRNIKQPFYRYFFNNCLVTFSKKSFGKSYLLNRRIATSLENKLRKFTTVQSGDADKFVVAYGLGLPFREVHRYNGIFPLKELVFEDGVFWVPNDCDGYLRDLYGDTYMQLPKAEDRKPCHCTCIVADVNQLINSKTK